LAEAESPGAFTVLSGPVTISLRKTAANRSIVAANMCGKLGTHPTWLEKQGGKQHGNPDNTVVNHEHVFSLGDRVGHGMRGNAGI
jgi:hypothetical protein